MSRTARITTVLFLVFGMVTVPSLQADAPPCMVLIPVGGLVMVYPIEHGPIKSQERVYEATGKADIQEEGGQTFSYRLPTGAALEDAAWSGKYSEGDGTRSDMNYDFQYAWGNSNEGSKVNDDPYETGDWVQTPMTAYYYGILPPPGFRTWLTNID